MSHKEVEHSSNINNMNNVNDFLAENQTHTYLFNQMTDKYTDNCNYENQLKLSTKPMKYHTNSLNNISSLPNNENHLSFTPIGNAQTVHISGEYERFIPSTLQKKSSTYTFNYNTSPFLGSENNINSLNTDTDLILKTGLTMKPKNNQYDLAEKKWPVFGDIYAASMAVTVQNAGQFHPRNLSNSKYHNIPGLDNIPTQQSKGIGVIGMDRPISSTVALKNYENGPFL